MKLIGPLAIPDPLESHEAFEKFHHLDLGALSRRALLVELWRCQQGLAELGDARTAENELAWDWLWARYGAVQECL